MLVGLDIGRQYIKIVAMNKTKDGYKLLDAGQRLVPEPNQAFDPDKIDTHHWVMAIKDIKKGEELTCDYGFSYDENYKQFPCKCRSKNCCGYIVRAESRWRINKKFSISRQQSNK